MGGAFNLIALILTLNSALITLIHCGPVEFVYNGDRCDCPRKLGYQIHVPRVSKPCKYHPREIGYKLDVPVPAGKGKITYTYDFVVEEPRKPKPEKPCKLKLYAKVDRVAINKPDCPKEYKKIPTYKATPIYKAPPAYAAPPGYEAPPAYEAPPTYEVPPTFEPPLAYAPPPPSPAAYPIASAYATASAYDAAPASPLASYAHPYSCNCAKCGVSSPVYRYVFKISPPCKCRQSNCKCKVSKNPQSMPKQFLNELPNEPPMSNPESAVEMPESNDDEKNHITMNIIRRKRSLRDLIFRPRRIAAPRSPRFVKLYHKDIASPNPNPLFGGLEDFMDPATRKTKRKSKKAFIQSRLVKRDIKGEYDQLERDLQEMDLTLPDIIQYMPETLQPSFKRGQCLYGCNSNSQKAQQYPQEPEAEYQQDFKSYAATEPSAATNEQFFESYTESPMQKQQLQKPHEYESPTRDQQQQQQQENSKKNEKSLLENNNNTNNIKRNAGLYKISHAGLAPATPTARSSSHAAAGNYPPGAINQARSLYQHPPPPLPVLPPSPPPLPLPPSYLQPKSLPLSPALPAPANPLYPLTVPPQYVYDSTGQAFVENQAGLSTVVTSDSIPDPSGTDPTPLRYAGDLDAIGDLPDLPDQEQTLGAPNRYPVQFVSNSQLDRIITDIVYRHPEFVEASTHYGGGLVDPEPLQELQTTEFLKKLIDGRLRLWLNGGHKAAVSYHNLDYNTDPQELAYGVLQ